MNKKMKILKSESLMPLLYAPSVEGKGVKLNISTNGEDYSVYLDFDEVPQAEAEAHITLLKLKLETAVRSEFIKESEFNLNIYSAVFSVRNEFRISGILNHQTANKYYAIIRKHMLEQINLVAFTRQSIDWDTVADWVKCWFVLPTGKSVFSSEKPFLCNSGLVYSLPPDAITCEAPDFGFHGDWAHLLLERGQSTIQYTEYSLNSKKKKSRTVEVY